MERRPNEGTRAARRAYIQSVIRISITPAAFDAIADTLPLGSVAVEPEANANGERQVWVDVSVANKLSAMRGHARACRTSSSGSPRSRRWDPPRSTRLMSSCGSLARPSLLTSRTPISVGPIADR